MCLWKREREREREREKNVFVFVGKLKKFSTARYCQKLHPSYLSLSFHSFSLVYYMYHDLTYNTYLGRLYSNRVHVPIHTTYMSALEVATKYLHLLVTICTYLGTDIGGSEVDRVTWAAIFVRKKLLISQNQNCFGSKVRSNSFCARRKKNNLKPGPGWLGCPGRSDMKDGSGSFLGWTGTKWQNTSIASQSSNLQDCNASKRAKSKTFNWLNVKKDLKLYWFEMPHDADVINKF